MSYWTPDRSALLSLLLDGVTGTKELIEFRQDYCKLHDCLQSNTLNGATNYWTGSKAEGLDLPGSDYDYMVNVNDMCSFKVIQSLPESPIESQCSVFYMCTENTPPGFALLRCIKPMTKPMYAGLVEYFNGMQYLSSNLIMDSALFRMKNITTRSRTTFAKTARQGPSLEQWNIFNETDESGTDFVMSIHCPFWPNDLSEWHERPRQFGWPTTRDMSSIVNFGFHLVPVGHPDSRTKFLEWRISFSLAERTLVWSFNHTQMQCYAVMKIILKRIC